MASNNNFDWDSWNKTTNRIPAGLAIYLAVQLLDGVFMSYHKFKNPLESDVGDILAELEQLRTDHKKTMELKDRQTKSEPGQS